MRRDKPKAQVPKNPVMQPLAGKDECGGKDSSRAGKKRRRSEDRA